MADVIDNIIETGRGLIGKAKFSHDYRPPHSLDCSSFIYYIFLKNGINLGTIDDDLLFRLGKPVPLHDLQKGDLVFFNKNKGQNDITHVALYIGNGQLLHMTNPRQNVIINSLRTYMNYYVAAKRVL